jgi:hypothetical protein
VFLPFLNLRQFLGEGGILGHLFFKSFPALTTVVYRPVFIVPPKGLTLGTALGEPELFNQVLGDTEAPGNGFRRL